MKNSILGAVYLSLAASIWGGMYVVSMYVLHFIPPITLVWLRYAIRFIVLYAILNIVQRKTKVRAKMDKKDWLIIGWIDLLDILLRFPSSLMTAVKAMEEVGLKKTTFYKLVRKYEKITQE